MYSVPLAPTFPAAAAVASARLQGMVEGSCG
jgi:hypothetical protein